MIRVSLSFAVSIVAVATVVTRGAYAQQTPPDAVIQTFIAPIQGPVQQIPGGLRKGNYVLTLEEGADSRGAWDMRLIQLPAPRQQLFNPFVSPSLNDGSVRFVQQPLEARADGERTGWKPDEAGKYLDERANVWFTFDSRGEGATRSTCVSCHTVLPYALARPVLRKLVGTETPTEQETRLLAQTRMRVENWKRLDTKAFGLFYDSSDQMKKQSWGTEAVFNSAILAFDDRYQGRSSPSDATKQAFSHLWETQAQAGEHKGSWDWLDFGEAPWGNTEARYFGAALAAIAVGTAPGYYRPGADTDNEARVKLLAGYLRDGLPSQNLHNRIWGLWAATKVEGILTEADRNKFVDQLFDQQQDDGGWSLPSLGTWVRIDGTAQQTASDGYATALALHVLQTAGVPKDDAKIAKGLAWLKRNQAATGAWPSVSVVKKRDPASHSGKFMSDGATGYAVLALSH